MNYKKTMVFFLFVQFFYGASVCAIRLTCSVSETDLEQSEVGDVVNALYKGELEQFMRLVNKDNFSSCTLNGYSLFHHACRARQLSIVEYLISLGAVVNEEGMLYEQKLATPLHCAALSKDNGKIISLLLSHGASINSVHHEYGYTPLHCAVMNAAIENVRILCEHEGVVVDQADGDQGCTPLQHLACDLEMKKQPMLDTFSVLVECGASAYVKSPKGKTFFDFLETSEHRDAAEEFRTIVGEVRVKKLSAHLRTKFAQFLILYPFLPKKWS